MELICNELSFQPIAENTNVAEERFAKILQTFKVAKEKYGFGHIRFPLNHAKQQVTTTQTFYEWLSTISNHTLKNLVADLCKAPFTDDLEQKELDTFYKSNYVIASEDAPTKDTPIGLSVAFIKAIPTISFDSHNFWRNRKILIDKTNGNEYENATFFTYNICLPSDMNSIELNDWANHCFSNVIDASGLLIKYLSYTKYTVDFTENFLKQFFEWKENNTELYKYILLLMKDVEIHPFTDGMGQTENLKSRGKEASKRITQADRLSYSVENNVVIFIACKGHYEFHD